MKEIQVKCFISEILSLAKIAGVKYDERLSQNELAVTPNGLHWLFLRPNTAKGAGVNPSYIGNVNTLYFPFMVWLILQNKPVGEYVKRLLIQPRVRPHRPFMGKLLKTELGASIMTANPILSHSLTVLADEYHRHSELHTQNPYAGHGDKANAIYNAMNELVKLINERNGAKCVPPKPKTITERITALFSTPAIRVFAKGGAR
ncbi:MULTISPECIES: hypothetical protein [unclassified Moraxella]|uniref:hypothetical protein n=1 Tax=unclassified Moraxella TaxID=2685852 RepID=UPI00359DEC0B